MSYQQKCLLVFGVAAFGLAIILTPEMAWARAGGGSAKGGSLWELVLLPVILIYAGVVTWLAAKKSQQAKTLLRQISAIDPVWEIDEIKARIEETYFKVQEAWRERNQDIARDYMSLRLYDKHKRRTDDMLRRGIRNVMENINLKKAQIVEVLDYQDDTRDSFWVLITGSMIDYSIVEQSGEIIDGEKKNRTFKELWRFRRAAHGWVLDEIDQDVSIADLRNFSSASEDIAPPRP